MFSLIFANFRNYLKSIFEILKNQNLQKADPEMKSEIYVLDNYLSSLK